jgi:O-acetyl-ADP-ribose deacetylase (regulator of RNase III)
MDKLPTGEAIVTDAFNLPSKYVIHTPGPVGERPELLASCYREVLSRCKERGMRTVAMCCISTGLFGYPADRAAEVAIATTRRWLDQDAASGSPSVDLVVFNTFLESDLVIYQKLLGP